MKSNFLITAFVLMALSIAAGGYLIINFPPSIVLIAVVILLISLFTNLLSALILHKFAKTRAMESDRDRFRRLLKTGFILACIVAILLVLRVKV